MTNGKAEQFVEDDSTAPEYLPSALEWTAPYLRVLFWPFRPRPRNVLAWILAISLGLGYLLYSWRMDGFASCDFASAWLTGRMFSLNKAHGLYLVAAERPVLDSGYTGKVREDLDWQILGKGHDDLNKVVVEGPLYPPTAGLLYWPLATLSPEGAHAVAALIYIQLAFFVAWLLRRITHRRLQMGEAALLVMLFPNYSVSVVLGQNSIITLTILAGGWALLQRARDKGQARWEYVAGLVWGLLAYKPVFAVAFILVPLILLQWRMLIGMVVGSAVFAAATLPFLLPPEQRCLWEWNEGRAKWEWVMDRERAEKAIAPWQRWREVGDHAADMYTYDRNWVWMSRDLAGLPRRDMWDREHFRAQMRYVMGLESVWSMDMHQAVHADKELAPLCIGLLVAAGAVTVLGCGAMAWRQRRHGGVTSPTFQTARDAFVLLGAGWTTYHFMHYDLLVFALPVALLLENASERAWWRWSPPLEFALGVTLVVCLTLLTGLWQAARFLEVRHPPPAPAAPTAESAATGHSPPSQTNPASAATRLEAAGSKPSVHEASTPTIAAKASSPDDNAAVAAPVEYTVPAFVLWAYVGLAGIILAAFLAALAGAAWLQSWMFDAVLWTLLFFSAIDLAWVGPSTRIPFEMFVLLLAWIWSGAVAWREAGATGGEWECVRGRG